MNFGYTSVGGHLEASLSAYDRTACCYERARLKESFVVRAVWRASLSDQIYVLVIPRHRQVGKQAHNQGASYPVSDN